MTADRIIVVWGEHDEAILAKNLQQLKGWFWKLYKDAEILLMS